MPKIELSAWFAVALGSALGSMARYGVAVVTVPLGAGYWPWGTLVANILGSFGICLFARLTEAGGRIRAGPSLRLFVTTGFFGGFTTLSLFSLEAMTLFQQEQVGAAATYVLASLVLWLSGAWAGSRLGERWNQRPYRSG